MQIVDTNFILRYVLQDHAEFYEQAKVIIEIQPIVIPVEIVAEAVYVLEKVYQVERDKIRQTFLTLLEYENLTFLEKDVIAASLSLYCATIGLITLTPFCARIVRRDMRQFIHSTNECRRFSTKIICKYLGVPKLALARRRSGERVGFYVFGGLSIMNLTIDLTPLEIWKVA